MCGIVTVLVGTEPVKFQVHTNLLTHHSEYFRKALNGPWKEATERVVSIMDIEPCTCESHGINPIILFVNWTYTKQVPHSILEWADIDTSSSYYLPALRLYELIRAYAFGDRILAPDFCRATSNVITKMLNGYVPSFGICDTLVQLAFSKLPQACVILQNLIDAYCANWNNNQRNYSLEVQNRLPLDFHRRVSHKLYELGKMTDEEKGRQRCYFEHASDEEKGACPALHFRWDPEKGLGFFE
ncbi:hypothetical protein DE146DRAFT_700989 [Phaeosphaeria sp. MPI-PUGE-AT-0046c]|nr:hypothetical protein DE146DRAFT_700989 [Phaeosphaeria sp. MPI-PUGE-AT-0046c]